MGTGDFPLLDSVLNQKYRVIRGVYRDDSGSIYLVNELNSNKTYTMKEVLSYNDKIAVLKELERAAEETVKIDIRPDSPRIIDFFVDEKKGYFILDSYDETSVERIKTYSSLGRILRDRYVVVRGVASGGFGSVYLVRDVSLPGKFWALKEMHDDSESQEVIEKSFKIEAEMLAKLDHPAIPRVTDFFIEGRQLYLVMDYIKGESLRKMLKELPEDEYFSEEKILEWALQLCDVLHYLHNRPSPIVFRDLKPDNILMTEGGRIKLIDFGIARVFEASKKAHTKYALLTEGYAPQEQWLGKAEPRSDIYSLGATLFYLATKVHPKEAAPEFPPPHTINKNISQGFSDIVLKALEPKISDRHENIMVFRDKILDLRKVKETGIAEEIHMEKAKAYEKDREYLKASFEYMKVIEFNKENREALKGMGSCYEALGLKDKALEHYNKILEEHEDEDFKKEIRKYIASFEGSKETATMNEDETLMVVLSPTGEIKTEEIDLSKKDTEKEDVSLKEVKKEEGNGLKSLESYTLILEEALSGGNLTEEKNRYLEEKRIELGISEDKATKILKEVKIKRTGLLSPSEDSRKKKKGIPILPVVIILLLIIGLSLFGLYKAGFLTGITPELLCAGGEEALRDGDTEKALETYLKASELFPENKEVIAGLAEVYTRIGNNFMSEENYEKAMDSYKDALLYSSDKDGLELKIMEAYIKAGDLNSFREVFNDYSAGEADENSLPLLKDALLKSIEQRNREEFSLLFSSLMQYRKKFSDDELTPVKMEILNWTEEDLNKEEVKPEDVEAILDLAEEIDIEDGKKEMDESYVRLMNKYGEMGQQDKVEMLLEKVSDRKGYEKDFASLFKTIALAYLNAGNNNLPLLEITDRTIKDLNGEIAEKDKALVLENEKNKKVSAEELSVLLSNKGFTEEEIKLVAEHSVELEKPRDYLEKSLKLEPDDFEARLALAQCYLGLKDYDDSIAAAKSLGENSAAYKTIADAYMGKGEPGNSLEWYKKILELEPDDFEARLALAQCYLGLKDYDDSIAAAKSLGENSAAYKTIADAYMGKEDFKTSLEWYKKILKLEPDNKEILYSLVDMGILEIGNKNFDSAMNIFKSAKFFASEMKPEELIDIIKEDFALAYMKEGEKLFNESLYGDAKVAFEKAKEILPEDPQLEAKVNEFLEKIADAIDIHYPTYPDSNYTPSTPSTPSNPPSNNNGVQIPIM